MRVTKTWVSLFILGALVVGGLRTVYSDEPPGAINQIPPIPDVVARVNGSEISAKPQMDQCSFLI